MTWQNGKATKARDLDVLFDLHFVSNDFTVVNMGLFAKAFLAATAVASVGAVDIAVQSSGGNQTGKFGHSYGYGFLHEVITSVHTSLPSADTARTLTTPAMAVSTLS